jgi:rhodanese-related sulfurtransferase
MKPAVPEIDVKTAARDLEANTTIQFVDVREPDEWAAGRIAEAVLIPLGDLPARARELDPARPVVVVCRSGNRSATATDFLLRSGFRDVKNLVGGMIAWGKAGYPMVSGPSVQGTNDG